MQRSQNEQMGKQQAEMPAVKATGVYEDLLQPAIIRIMDMIPLQEAMCWREGTENPGHTHVIATTFTHVTIKPVFSGFGPGAGRGIGRALAKEIAKAKGEVFALSRTKETLDSLVNESDRIHPIVADVGDWNGTRDVLDKLDTVDGVVNNAGELVLAVEPALDCPKTVLDRAININLLGAINVIQMTGKKMVTAGKGGSIVNISSMAAVNPAAGTMFYNMTKAALDMVTKQFALELGPHQIRVNSVAPGFVLTKTVSEHPWYVEPTAKGLSMTPLGRLCTVPEVVDPILYLLSDYSKMVTGTRHIVDGGMLSHIPL